MKKKTLLYQITDSNSKHYLFGTIHISDDRIPHLLESIKPYIHECNTFVSETSIDDLINLSAQHNILSEDTHTMKDFFTGDKLDKIVYFLSHKLNISPIFIQDFTPFSLYNMLVMNELSQNGSHVMDYILWMYAKDNNFQMNQLESVDFQQSVALQLDHKLYAKSIKDIVRKYDNFRNEMKKTLEYYFSMDLQQLYKHASKSLKSQKSMMIYDRNQSMTDRILDLGKQNSLFIAVGAAHLPGHKGILRKLKHKGFQITPILLQ